MSAEYERKLQEMTNSVTKAAAQVCDAATDLCMTIENSNGQIRRALLNSAPLQRKKFFQ